MQNCTLLNSGYQLCFDGDLAQVGVEVSICGVNGFDCLVGVPSPPPSVLGDVNGDGIVSVEDIILLVGIVTGSTGRLNVYLDIYFSI